MKKSNGFFLIIMGLIGLFLTFALTASGQSQTFSTMRLVDKYGLEDRQVESRISLLTGIIEITEAGATWQEEIITQTKGTTFCRVTTSAGEYTIYFNYRGGLVAVHLRSVIGADRSYINPVQTKTRS